MHWVKTIDVLISTKKTWRMILEIFPVQQAQTIFHYRIKKKRNGTIFSLRGRTHLKQASASNVKQMKCKNSLP